jgi:putative intracellular protease/amidase
VFRWLDADMNITILLFDRFTALDAVGPYEVLQRLPGANLTFVAPEPGPVSTDTKRLTMLVETKMSDVTETDVLVVPGGHGTRALEKDETVLEWVRQIHPTTRFTTSVCTGSLVLAAAGILKDVEATCHWGVIDRLAEHGAIPKRERVVRRGKIFTAAGVSAGIDMALVLAAEIAGVGVAQAIQLGIEYDPAPPFDAGSPNKAPKEITELVRSRIARV